MNSKYYFVSIEDDVNVSETDIDYILQWNYAKHIWFNGENIFILHLQERISTLKGLNSVTKIRASVSAKTYKKLRLNAFVDALGSLRRFSFYREKSITIDQFNEFKKNLILPARWKCLDEDDNSYECKRKRKCESFY